MSLIQEALKRQQQEYESGAPPAAPSSAYSDSSGTETMPVIEKPAAPDGMPAPTVRTPLSPAVPPPPPPALLRSSKPWKKIGGVVGMAIVILVVGSLIVAKWALKVVQKKAIPMLAVHPAPSTPSAGVSVVKADPGAAQGIEHAAPQPLPQPPSPVAAVATPLPAQASVQPTSPLEAELAEKVETLPAGKPSVEKSPPAPLQWPSLKLTGILASPKAGEGAARINKQMVYVGGQIDGVLLVEIRTDGVVLKYGEETKFLKIGGVVY